MPCQLFISVWETRKMAVLVLTLLSLCFSSCQASFSVFISNAELESYFRDTVEFDTIQGQMVDIVRDGESRVSEDGRVLLTEAELISSGSGEAPPSQGEGEGRRWKRQGFLMPMDTLPTFPAHVDEVVFSWVATVEVSYRLSLAGTPTDHFSDISSNISASGSIPLELSEFSVRFPCSPSANGVGMLEVTLNTTVQTTMEAMTVSFLLEKNCQAPTSTPSTPIVPSTTLLPFTSLPATPLSTSVSNTPTTGFIQPSSTSSVVSPARSSVEDVTVMTLTTLSLEATPIPSATLQATPAPPSSPTPDESDDSDFLLLVIVFSPVVGVLVASICILCCSLCICFCCCRRKSKRHFNDDPADLPVNMGPSNVYLDAFELEEKKAEVPVSLWMALNWGSVSNLPAGIQGIIKHFGVDRRSLNILNTVSRGDYGCIVNGQLVMDRTDPVGGNKGVMMKMCIGFQKQYGHYDEITRFMECATLLRGVDHAHIHSLMRVSVEDNYVPLVIYPIMEYGNLHQFLTLCRLTPADSPLSPVTLQYKVSFAYQIASGMQHLSESGIVHPDLALRNCFLDTNYQVKISDGALSQCFYPECYHLLKGTVRPVRWSAIETLQEGLCTTLSNVWSYGVTLWEVMTLGRLPYLDEVDHNRTVVTYLLMQNRLHKPEGCPDNIYSIMSSCWKKRAEDRPNFNSVLSLIGEIHSKYAATQSMAPPTTHTLIDTNYSTFGKDLRPHEDEEAAAAVTAATTSSYYRKRRSQGSFRSSSLPRHSSPGGSLRRNNQNSASGSQRNSQNLPPGSQRNSQNLPPGSQRNSQNFLGVEGGSLGGERLSITFSVLSNNEFDQQTSCSEDEEEKDLNFEIPSFLVGGAEEMVGGPMLDPSSGAAGGRSDFKHRQSDMSPMDLVSTFMPASKSVPRDHTDSAATPSLRSPPPGSSLAGSTTPTAAPPTITPTSPAYDTTSFCSSPLGPQESRNGGGGDSATPSLPLSSSITPDMARLATSVTPSNQDIPTTPDSIITPGPYDPDVGSGPNSVLPPSSHIPGIPNSTYNNTSVSIDDVRLRNKMDSGSHTAKSASVASYTPSGASKSDSGIRSDEEVESVLSNGNGGVGLPPGPPPEKVLKGPSRAAPPPPAGVAKNGSPKNPPSIANVGKKDSNSSLGMDLMAQFATWGK